MEVYNKIAKGQASIAVVGLGQTGKRISAALSRNFKVKALDLDQNHESLMQEGLDSLGYLSEHHVNKSNLSVTHDYRELQDAVFYIVTVPTPADKQGRLNLMALREATIKVANIIKPGDYVVFESTVKPGTTEEVCLPILESNSGLKINQDFKMGYTPERIKVGELEETAASVVKIVSGSDQEALNDIGKLFRAIIPAGVHLAPSIRIAEVAQLVQTTQREVNRALLDEFSQKFLELEQSTKEVLAAIGMPANFLYRLGF